MGGRGRGLFFDLTFDNVALNEGNGPIERHNTQLLIHLLI